MNVKGSLQHRSVNETASSQRFSARLTFCSTFWRKLQLDERGKIEENKNVKISELRTTSAWELQSSHIWRAWKRRANEKLDNFFKVEVFCFIKDAFQSYFLAKVKRPKKNGSVIGHHPMWRTERSPGNLVRTRLLGLTWGARSNLRRGIKFPYSWGCVCPNFLKKKTPPVHVHMASGEHLTTIDLLLGADDGGGTDSKDRTQLCKNKSEKFTGRCVDPGKRSNEAQRRGRIQASRRRTASSEAGQASSLISDNLSQLCT